ncbi:inhibitor of growth proteins N-terminal histone-binding-domain-containing protein [Mortierella sp. GBAus27b]|nr:inhibitor of growth proteins N-terminal histone-binding-domain-containing protein [Mortierella sp. GBAus27b]
MKTSGSTTTRAAESLAYLDDYLDTVESLPLELQRQFTLMQDLDAKAQSIMAQVGSKAAEFIDNVQTCTSEERIKMLQSLNEMLLESLRQGEEKVALATAAYDVVDRHVRRLDDDLQKYEDEQMIGPGRLGNVSSSASGATALDRKEESSNPATSNATSSNKKGASSSAQDNSTSKRKKTHNATNSSSTSNATSTPTGEKRKGGNITSSSANKVAKKTTSFTELPIDPNEPLYCYCQQVSYGEMVACDNADCEIEWFHLSCAGLKAPPKGKWYCKDCSQKSKKPQKK